MTDIDTALTRMDSAIGRLEAAFAAAEHAVEAGLSDAEHARLLEEVEALRERAQQDARLREEAAGAVREALRDLRGAVTP